MKEVIANITTFIKRDLIPNLWYYLVQIFLIVLVVIAFALINIVVRFVTDPLCIKVLRMKENKRGPGMVGLVIALLITTFLLIAAYNLFPQLEPTVIGWAGKNLQKVLTSDKMPDIEALPEKIKDAAQKAVSEPDKDKKTPSKPTPTPKPLKDMPMQIPPAEQPAPATSP